MRRFLPLATLTALSLFVACGSDPEVDSGDGDSFGDGDASSGDGDAGDGDSATEKDDINLGGGDGTGDPGGDGDGDLSGDGDATGDGDGDNFAECAASSAESNLDPVYLVFLLDQSGSMGDGHHGQRDEKWDPVTEALEAFFADEKSAGLYASLSLFPDDVNKTTSAASSSHAISCQAEDYSTPVVLPRALPDDSTFAGAIAAVDPPNEFGTPTYPALAGTVAYARTLADEGKKVAIVMVTDGNPAQCGNQNTVENTADAAGSVVDTIPTYVIGVGNSLEALNDIAESGGTEEAFIVDTDNPTQTRNDLLAQVQLIRGEQISCDLEIPDPPDGKELDPSKVNVELTTADDASDLGYNEDCEGGAGWHYDDPGDPQSISLCEDTCAMVQSSDGASVNVVFGCETQVHLIR